MSFIEINEFKRPGKKIKPEYITIHSVDIPLEDEFARISNTSNQQKYAWHIGIGEDDVIHAIPLDEFTYHAQAANDCSIAIMISMHIKSYEDQADFDRQRVALLNKASDIVAKYMSGFGFTISRLKSHKEWNEDKECPVLHVMPYEDFKRSVELKMPKYSIDPTLYGGNNGEEIEIAYDQTRALLSSGNIHESSNQTIRALVIQQTTKGSAFTAYSTIESDDEEDEKPPKAAHFVIDANSVVKYVPSSSSVWDNTTKWTARAIGVTKFNEERKKLDEEIAAELVGVETDDETGVLNKTDLLNPGNYTLVIDLCIDENNDLASVEINLIRFLTHYLKKHGLDTYNIWRAYDFVENFETPDAYMDYADFSTLLAEVSKCINQPKKEPVNIDRVEEPKWTKDRRLNSSVKKEVKITDITMNDEDTETVTIGANVFAQSRFEKGEQTQEFVTMQTNLYEPVYPDLTVPPRSASSLYNIGIQSPEEILDELTYREKNSQEKIFEIEKEIEGVETKVITPEDEKNIPLGRDLKQKPVIGKIPNLFDPYPIDKKIAQLEMHAPMVTLEYENASDVNSNAQFYMINRFINTEKRLVALENMLSAHMRMMHRMASRVSINCVYYGGQSVFDKYKCIRCLSDDLTNDAACVTMEQCMNCSRYEPIEGQVYEFMDKDAGPGKANLFDDVQASYMSKEDYVELNRIEQENVEDTQPYVDLTKTHIRLENDFVYDDLLADANNFVMNWNNVKLEKQSPHVNIYDYRFFDIALDSSRLDPKNKYEDGWKDVQQNKYRRPDYGINTLGGGGFGGTIYGNSSVGLYFGADDYEMDSSDLRYRILDYAKRACDLGSKGGFLYTLGAKIIDKTLTPEQLVEKAKSEEVSTFELGKGADDTHLAVYTDCSNFTNYVYSIASGGELNIPGSTAELADSKDFEVIGKGKTVLEALKEAIPGDLLLYRGQDNSSGHVSIYAGYDDCYEAFGDQGVEIEKQVLKNKVKDRSDFVGILRHPSLSVPKLKNIRYVDVKMSSAQFVKEYQLVQNRNTYDGTDHTYTNDFELIHNFVKTDDKMSTQSRLQFLRLDSIVPESILTSETLAKFLKKAGKNRNVDRSNSMPNPSAFIEAQRQTGINALFLLAHCAGETGWGTSGWMDGSGTYKDPQGRTLYNAYGIACFNSDGERKSAKELAAKEGWYSKEEAVIGGAKWIKNTYLSDEAVAKHGIRNTPYFMKWHLGNLIEGNAGNPGSMQYASHIEWAQQRADVMFQALYFTECGPDEAMKYLQLLIPRYKDPGLL